MYSYQRIVFVPLHCFLSQNHLVVKKSAKDRFASRNTELVRGDESKLQAFTDQSLVGRVTVDPALGEG